MRLFSIVLLILLLLIAGVGGYVWWTAPRQAERLAVQYLASIGIAPVKVSIARLGSDAVDIHRLEIGEPLVVSAQDVSFPYQPRTAMGGKVGAVHVKEATLHFPVRGGKLSFGVFDNIKPQPQASGVTSFTPANLPAPSLNVDLLHVVLENESGDERSFELHGVTLQRSLQEANKLLVTVDTITDRTSPPVITIPVRMAGEIEFTQPKQWRATFQGMEKQVTLNIYGTGDRNYLENSRARLDVRSMAIQTLVALLMEKNLAISGTFSGTLPLRYRNNHFVIDDAAFVAKEPGVIQYTGGGEAFGTDSEQAALVSAALRNFHYQLLSFNVNTISPTRTQISASLQGNNPDLYDGKLINLNITIGGDLEGIVKNTLAVYGLPSEIEKKARSN